MHTKRRMSATELHFHKLKMRVHRTSMLRRKTLHGKQAKWATVNPP